MPRALAVALAVLILAPSHQGLAAEDDGAAALGLRGAVGREGDGEGEPPQPVPRRSPAEVDPYAPLGVRVGSLLLFPSLELRAGYSDNIAQSAEAPRAAAYGRLMPALELRSDWSRHELRGRAGASYRRVADGGVDAMTGFDSELAGRIDIRTGVHADLRASYLREPEGGDDPNVSPGAAVSTDVTRLRGEAGLTRRVGRASISLRGALQQTAYEGNQPIEQSARDYRTDEVSARASYDLVEGAALFVEAGVNRRRYPRSPDPDLPRRGSRGYETLAGLEMRLTGLLTGEFGAGYQRQIADDPFFPVIEGLIVRGALVWEPTALTTLSLGSSLTPEEASIDPLAAGARVGAVELTLVHAFRRNLLGSIELGYTRSDYVGSPRRETAYRASVGLEYMLSREVALIAEAAHRRHRSNLPGDDFEENRVEVGVRVRR